MSNFQPAIALVLKHEGSTYTEADGLPTKFGLNKRLLQDYGLLWDAQAIASMTQAQAEAIYRGALWDKYQFGRITNQLVCNYLFDMAVNMGMFEAVKLAQRGIWAATGSTHLPDDGILGIVTVGDINNASQCYLPILRALRIAFYMGLVEHDATKRQWLHGWLERACAMPL